MEFDQGPCEYCGELFPFDLLIQHQSIHFYEDYEARDENFLIEDNMIEENVPTVETVNDESEEIALELALMQSVITDPEIAIEQTQVQSSCTEPKVIEEKEIHSPKSSNANTEAKKNEYRKLYTQTIEEFTTKTGEKLLVYGADIEPVEELESEKQSYKIPNNPLLNNIPKEEDVEDINNLSDDDSDESLEEFWKRARDFLKRSRVKTEC